MIPWQERTVEYEQLRKYATQFSHFEYVVPWLYAIGVLPNDVTSLPEPTIKTELNPNSIKCGYLAASAFQWDAEGPSSPHDFLDAIEFEIAGSAKKAAAAEALKELGRDIQTQSSSLDVSLIDSPERDRFRDNDDIGWDGLYGTS